MGDRSSRLFWYRRYPGDLAIKQRGWPPLARLIYVELLDVQWDRGDLPESEDELRSLIPGIGPDEWNGAWQYVEEHFPLVSDRRQNADLEEERAHAGEIIEKRSRAGKRSAEVRLFKPAS